ncbi:MAG: hypothetical protein JRI92_07440 [Deltaproteobacteria bacterium]|nr:hypothetical protein [Deltaproteobacteria bacterium]
MATEVVDDQTALSFFREHPILILTFSALLCSAVGYWSEYSLLKEFGLNIVVFAEADDFFLAGLKSPKIFMLSFPLFAVGIAYISFRVNRLAREQQYILREELEISREIEMAKIGKEREKAVNLEAKQKEMRNHFKMKLSHERRRVSLWTVPIILGGVVFIFILLQMELNKNLERTITNPEMKATIQLRTRDTLPKTSENPLVFITATEKFMFFYQHNSSDEISTVAIPISSIANVTYSPFKTKEEVKVVKPKDKPSNKALQPTPKSGAAEL